MGTQKSSGEYVLQTESYNIIVSYNATEVSPLCHTWKTCTCFGVCILVSVVFFVQQVISSLGSDYQSQDFIQT